MEHLDNRKSFTKESLLIVILDGWRRDIFEELLETGQLYGIQRIVEDGVKLDTIISNLPSVSIASHLSIVTGSFIDQHQIPGHRWFDRQHKKVRSYFSLDVSKKITEDASPNVSTAFEYLRYKHSISVQAIANRGAMLKLFYPTMSGKKLLQKTAKILCTGENQVVVTWLPKVDSLAHKYGPDSPKVRREMIDTSKAFDSLITTIQNEKKYESTKFILLPDHGQRAVAKSVDLRKLFRHIGLKALVNPQFSHDNRQLIFTSGDSFAQVYLTDDCLAQRNEIALKLSAFQEIELACWQQEGGRWHITSAQGGSIAEWVGEPHSLMQYQLEWGCDPLGILESSQETILDLSSPMLDGNYPDFLHQLTRSYVSNRSGDLILFPSREFHFGKAPRIGFRLGFHRGTHGGPFPEEMVVSGVVKGAKIENKAIRMADVLHMVIES